MASRNENILPPNIENTDLPTVSSIYHQVKPTLNAQDSWWFCMTVILQTSVAARSLICMRVSHSRLDMHHWLYICSRLELWYGHQCACAWACEIGSHQAVEAAACRVSIWLAGSQVCLLCCCGEKRPSSAANGCWGWSVLLAVAPRREARLCVRLGGADRGTEQGSERGSCKGLCRGLPRDAVGRSAGHAPTVSRFPVFIISVICPASHCLGHRLHWPPLSATSTTATISTLSNLAMCFSPCQHFRIQDTADPSNTNILQNPD